MKSGSWKETGIALILLIAMAIGCHAASRHYYRAVYPIKYESYIRQSAAEYGVDPLFLCVVIKAESDFTPSAVSVNDACGLMQLLPSTLDWLQQLTPEEDHYVRADLIDPEINVRYGAFFIARLFERFQDPATVAAAYHAGVNGVRRWLENPDYSADGIHLDVIPYADTAQYVRKIERYYEIYRKLYPEG